MLAFSTRRRRSQGSVRPPNRLTSAALFSFALAAVLAVPVSAGRTADVDRDGVTEDWSIETRESELVLAGRDAEGSLLAALPLPMRPPQGWQLADLNEDGIPDLATDGRLVIDGRRLVSALRGSTPIRGEDYAEIWNTGTDLRNVWDCEVDDLDQDGEPEVTGQSYHYPGTLVHVYECAGDGVFERVWHADTLFTPSLNSVATGDTDGDDEREVIAGEVGTLGRVYLWEVVGDDELEPRPLNFDMNPYDGAIRDVRIGDGDADGRREIVVTTGDATEGGAVGIFEHSGAIGENSYTPVQVYETVSYMLGVSPGDSDNDGNGEYILRVGGGGGTFPLNLRRLEYNPISGLYEHKLIQPGPLGLPISSAVGDLDGDGQNELVVGGAGSSGGFLYLFESPSNDSYTLAWSNGFAINGNVMDVAIGLPNEHGYPTIAAASFGGQVELIGYDGAGYVREMNTSLAVGGAARSVRQTLADCPDLTADLVVAVSGIDQLRVYERQGVEGESGEPQAVESWRIAPSPFALRTRIEPPAFVSGPGTLRVADVTGRVVRSWVLSPVGEVTWDGTDRHGRSVAPGAYFLSFQAGGKSWNRALVRLR